MFINPWDPYLAAMGMAANRQISGFIGVVQDSVWVMSHHDQII